MAHEDNEGSVDEGRTKKKKIAETKRNNNKDLVHRARQFTDQLTY